jgi:hypothetical protein
MMSGNGCLFCSCRLVFVGAFIHYYVFKLVKMIMMGMGKHG